MNFGKTTSIIISGSAFLYLLAQSTKFLSSRIKIERQLKPPDDDDTLKLYCCICNTEKVDVKDHLFVTCKGCNSLICTNSSCSEHVSELDIWECNRCKKNRIVQQKTGEWFLKQLKDFSAFNFEMALGENILNLQNENGNKIIISKVRELIEKCLIKILNGTDLDATPTDQISESEESTHTLSYHDKDNIVQNLPNPSCVNTDYVELKRFINRICQEVIAISDTLEFSDSSVPSASFDPQTYEELLATAVLNKITSDYHHRKKHGMSSQLAAEKDSETANDEEFDFSFYDKMHLDKIQSHKISLPDLLNEFDTVNDEDYENGNNHSGSWEGNWSMKRLGGDYKTSMLIPEPTLDIKAKIGEKDIDELSDSSNKDTNSENFDAIYEDDNERLASYIDFSDEEKDSEELFTNILHSTNLKADLKDINDDSKRSVLKIDNNYDIELDNEAIFNNISDLSSNEIKENIDEIFEQILGTESSDSNDDKTTEQKIPEEKNVISNDNKNSESQIEEGNAKYTSPLFTQYLSRPIQPIKISEALKNAPQNNTKEIPKSPQKLNESPINVKNTAVEKLAPISVITETNVLVKPKNEIIENSPPIPGSIAEREHLKWLKAIPIENNPYSPEALQKRLSRTHDKYYDISPDKHADLPSDYEEHKEDITKYKRDYYINQVLEPSESVNKTKNEPVESDLSYNADYSIDQPNDSSIATSDDSLTRIYTLSSQETTVILPSHKTINPINEEHESNESKVKKFDIEEENIDLPSVKKLAEFYASSSNISDINTKQHEPMNIPEGISKITSKRYATTDVPAKPIASITARTLPPKIKEDLRKSLHEDDLTIIRHSERNVSPDIQHGVARNSIAYFENFYK